MKYLLWLVSISRNDRILLFFLSNWFINRIYSDSFIHKMIQYYSITFLYCFSPLTSLIFLHLHSHEACYMVLMFFSFLISIATYIDTSYDRLCFLLWYHSIWSVVSITEKETSKSSEEEVIAYATNQANRSIVNL